MDLAMENVSDLDNFELFTPSEKKEAALIAARQFSAEGLEVHLGEDGSLQVAVPSLKEWLARHLALAPLRLIPLETGERPEG